MEEDIKILENIIVEYNTQVEDYKYFSVPVRLDERDIEALENLLTRYKQQDKVINEIKKEVREHIGFEKRLIRDNIEPDLFNQGRFYVANEIKNILEVEREGK